MQPEEFEYDLSVTEVDSGSELTEILRRRAISTNVIVLAHSDEKPREFLLLTVDGPVGQSLAVGIYCWGTGLRPVVVRRGSTLWVGYDLRVASIDLEHQSILWDRKVGSPIYDLIIGPARNDCLVIAEIALEKLDKDGIVIWQHSTQIVTHYEVDENEMRVEFDESFPVRIDLWTGRMTRWSR